MKYKTKEEIRERKRKWRIANPEKMRKQHRKYYLANREKAKEYSKKYYIANPEKIKEQSRKYKIANLEKIKEQDRKYYNTNKEEIRERGKQERKRIRREILKHYSNNSYKCANCGYDIYESLVIDHAYGGGNRHRKEIKESGTSSFYRWLKKNKFPLGFQVLCHDCNFLKSNYPKIYTKTGKKYRELKS